MTLDEAIEDCDRIPHKFSDRKEGKDHEQLRDWLKELRDRRNDDAAGFFLNETCDSAVIFTHLEGVKKYQPCIIQSMTLEGTPYVKVLTRTEKHKNPMKVLIPVDEIRVIKLVTIAEKEGKE